MNEKVRDDDELSSLSKTDLIERNAKLSAQLTLLKNRLEQATEQHDDNLAGAIGAQLTVDDIFAGLDIEMEPAITETLSRVERTAYIIEILTAHIAKREAHRGRIVAALRAYD